MSWQLRVHAASFDRLRLTSFLHRLRKLASTLLIAGVIQSCAAPPMTPFAGPDPSEPFARIPAVRYRSTIGPFASQRPAEPGPWQQKAEPAGPAANRVPEPK